MPFSNGCVRAISMHMVPGDTMLITFHGEADPNKALPALGGGQGLTGQASRNLGPKLLCPPAILLTHWKFSSHVWVKGPSAPPPISPPSAAAKP